MTKFNYHALVWREKNWYVARSLELEIASQGKSRKEALANLQEAVDLYLEDEDVNKFSLPKIDQPRLTQVKAI